VVSGCFCIVLRRRHRFELYRPIKSQSLGGQMVCRPRVAAH
jgi:hypothetical protein